MYDFPIEQEEFESGLCLTCGSSIILGDEFCSVACMQECAESFGESYRQPMSAADIRRMEMELFPTSGGQVPNPEGVELDIVMEQHRESLSNKEWAADQARKIRNDFRGKI